MQGKLLSNVERFRRGLSDDPSCHIYRHDLEDVIHILRDCPAAKDVWSQFYSTSQVDSSVGTEITSEAHLSEEQVYINTDGAVHLDSSFAAARGVVRDKSGNWITGFHRFLGKFSIFDAELWGILGGLKLVQRRGYDQILIYSDCLKVVKAIIGRSTTNSNSALIRRIHNI
ncbi:hypothetical protein PVK06_049178 [Gossypium arboreum]|uniref:RNase H type-1 domain-containing protein n=1 Tax=Gossypium arboreum TaxID=29729 RepID=A0ABR0MIF0_GOSAR|nr:hypothetical protein PVK06_049178 [Gossypium arboreum]